MIHFATTPRTGIRRIWCTGEEMVASSQLRDRYEGTNKDGELIEYVLCDDTSVSCPSCAPAARIYTHAAWSDLHIVPPHHEAAFYADILPQPCLPEELAKQAEKIGVIVQRITGAETVQDYVKYLGHLDGGITDFMDLEWIRGHNGSIPLSEQVREVDIHNWFRCIASMILKVPGLPIFWLENPDGVFSAIGEVLSYLPEYLWSMSASPKGTTTAFLYNVRAMKALGMPEFIAIRMRKHNEKAVAELLQMIPDLASLLA